MSWVSRSALVALLAAAPAGGPAPEPASFLLGGWVLEGEPILFTQLGEDGLRVTLPEGGRIVLEDGAVVAERIEANWSLATGSLGAEAIGNVSFERGEDVLGSHRLVLGDEGIQFSGGVQGRMGGVGVMGDALRVSPDGTQFGLEAGTVSGDGFRLTALSMNGAVDQSQMYATGRVVLEAEQEGRPSLLCLAENLSYEPLAGRLEAWPAEVSLGDGMTLAADKVVIDVVTGGLHAEGKFRLEIPDGATA